MVTTMRRPNRFEPRHPVEKLTRTRELHLGLPWGYAIYWENRQVMTISLSTGDA
jgi:hypothetical protein